jgi:hypothetical protein
VKGTTSFETKRGNEMAANNKPTHTLRHGNIEVTIWQNVSEKGPFFATGASQPDRQVTRA